MPGNSVLDDFKPHFLPGQVSTDSATVQAIIEALNLRGHPEGGYFVETDRDKLRVPNPFLANNDSITTEHDHNNEDLTRSASTTIFYMLTPANPMGRFHRNKARTVHTLHRGRGCYVLIHANEAQTGQKVRVEKFVVGHDVSRGEKLQWIVEGGIYKASYLLPDAKDGQQSGGLLISEVRHPVELRNQIWIGNSHNEQSNTGQTVVPGFEFADHDFLRADKLKALVTADEEVDLDWLLGSSIRVADPS